jgi:hypothetical protein
VESGAGAGEDLPRTRCSRSRLTRRIFLDADHPEHGEKEAKSAKNSLSGATNYSSAESREQKASIPLPECRIDSAIGSDVIEMLWPLPKVFRFIQKSRSSRVGAMSFLLPRKRHRGRAHQTPEDPESRLIIADASMTSFFLLFTSKQQAASAARCELK